MVFLAVLSLLAEAAESRPLLCVVDDAQWLDSASSDALLFVGRRLGSDPIALLFAAREGDVRRFDGAGIPELVLSGLDGPAALAVLNESAGRPVAAAGSRRAAATHQRQPPRAGGAARRPQR